jgi:hypothetical protein
MFSALLKSTNASVHSSKQNGWKIQHQRRGALRRPTTVHRDDASRFMTSRRLSNFAVGKNNDDGFDYDDDEDRARFTSDASPNSSSFYGNYEKDGFERDDFGRFASSSSSSSSSSSPRASVGKNARGFDSRRRVDDIEYDEERRNRWRRGTDDDDDRDSSEYYGRRERGGRPRRSSYSFSREQGAGKKKNNNKSAALPLPNVTLLTNGEVQKCLPIAATSNQYGYFWGTTDAAVQRVAISLLGVVLCSTINDFEIGTALQVPFATFFLWAPIALAARRNAAARAGEFVGLWRAEVKDIEVVEVLENTFDTARRKKSSRGNRRKVTSEMLLIDFIDPISSFEVTFRIPNERRYDDVQIGDACELLVSSDDDLFRNFVAIREAYVPELDVWVGEYPFLDRNGFVLVSKRV